MFYNSRRQVDDLLENIRKTGKLDSISFGQKRDPCASFFQKLKTSFNVRRNNDPHILNVGVTISQNPSGLQSLKKPGEFDPDHPKTLVVKTDNSRYKEIDRETLEPMGIVSQKDLHPELKGSMSSAHPQYDPVNGDLFNYNLDFGASATYRIFKTSFKTGKTEILATIADKAVPAAYIHSLFLTEGFVVLAVWSSHFAGNGVKVLWERNLLDAITPFDSKATTKWIVIDRRHGRGVVAKFESPAMFSFHTVNAWQEPSEREGAVDLHCQLVQFPTIDILHRFYYENILSLGPGAPAYSSSEGVRRENVIPSLTRYKLASVPIGKSRVPEIKTFEKAEVVLSLRNPLIGELPTINPSYATKKSRYVYSLVDEGYSSWVDGIVKLDTETKEATYWRQPKSTPGEPIFVQDPRREGEDAGYLLSVMLDGVKGTSYLLCLDAKTMKETGRAECDMAVGMGFHGSHVA